MQIHAALVEVLGVGVLIRGPSGIGKSETALELVARGHRLVADDLVRLHAEAGAVWGDSPPLIRHHLEIRGMGILFVPELYGPDTVRDEARVEMVCHLEEWRPGVAYERVGLERPMDELLDVRMPRIVLPMRPCGSMATLIEVAVRDHQGRRARRSAAERLDERVRRQAHDS